MVTWPRLAARLGDARVAPTGRGTVCRPGSVGSHGRCCSAVVPPV